MEQYFEAHTTELFWTVVTIVLLLIFRFISNKAVHRIGRLSDIVEARTILITKYISYVTTFLGVAVLTFVWGVNLEKLGLLFSSIFAVIGVALFAQWSILSNVTSGVILFFSFPFKIGDQIKIMDKDILDKIEPDEAIFVIEDIKAFHVHLRSPNGEIMTYPNNLMLQKAVVRINTYEQAIEGSEAL
jgi:small-conductance mechanosensitive channel